MVFCCCFRRKIKAHKRRISLGEPENGEVNRSEREYLTNRESTYTNNYSEDNKTIQSISDDSNHLTNYNWYYGFISRLQAHELLRPEENGTFLVRKSNDTTSEYPYIISVKHKPLEKTDNKENYHYRIRRDENGYFTLGWNLYFKTVKDLLDFYKGKTDILKVPLKTFIDHNQSVR